MAAVFAYLYGQIQTAHAAVKVVAASTASASSSGSTLLGASNLSDWVTKFVSWATTVGVSVAALMILYAGVEYINSAGNETKIKSAKDRALGSLLGLVILLLIGTIMRILLKTS